MQIAIPLIFQVYHLDATGFFFHHFPKFSSALWSKVLMVRLKVVYKFCSGLCSQAATVDTEGKATLSSFFDGQISFTTIS